MSTGLIKLNDRLIVHASMIRKVWKNGLELWVELMDGTKEMVSDPDHIIWACIEEHAIPSEP